MRQLTKRQKSYLDKWFVEYQPTDTDSLEVAHWQLLKQLNNTEILHQEVDRYLWDLKYSN